MGLLAKRRGGCQVFGPKPFPKARTLAAKCGNAAVGGDPGARQVRKTMDLALRSVEVIEACIVVLSCAGTRPARRRTITMPATACDAVAHAGAACVMNASRSL